MTTFFGRARVLFFRGYPSDIIEPDREGQFVESRWEREEEEEKRERERNGKRGAGLQA